LRDDVLNYVPGFFDACARAGRENDLFPAFGDVCDLLES
jgi:hypothetical protein